MTRNFRTSFSNHDIFQADGIIRHGVAPRSLSNTACLARTINGRRHTPAFAEFIQR